MARDWDTESLENNGTTSDQGARSSMGQDSKQAPMEEALVSLDTAISKLDKVVTQLLIQLGPVSFARDSNIMSPSSPDAPNQNSTIVSTLQEYKRRVTSIMTHVAIASDELEL